MQIKENEFYSYERIEVISNSDSGLFAVQYEQQEKTDNKPELKDSYEWRYGSNCDCYTLVLKKPIARKVCRTAVIMRTSANHYIIVYADKNGCRQNIVKSLSAVHDILTPLWTREL